MKSIFRNTRGITLVFSTFDTCSNNLVDNQNSCFVKYSIHPLFRLRNNKNNCCFQLGAIDWLMSFTQELKSSRAYVPS